MNLILTDLLIDFPPPCPYLESGSSPDKKTDIRVDTKGTITLSISYNNKEVVGPSPVCMELDQERILGRDAADYAKETQSITSADRLSVHLAPGGGWVARIRKTE